MVDRDGSGNISPEELRNVLRGVYKSDVSEADVYRMMQQIDKDQNGEISKEEFLEAIMVCVHRSFFPSVLFFIFLLSFLTFFSPLFSFSHGCKPTNLNQLPLLPPESESMKEIEKKSTSGSNAFLDNLSLGRAMMR